MTISPLTAFSPAPTAGAKNSAAAGQTAAPVATPTATATPVETPSLPDLLQTVLAAARQSAAARQDGLSVLMANALRATATANLPGGVKAAIDQLIALHLPTDKAPDAAAIKLALATSGLFTEAKLASHAAQIPVDVKTALLQLNHAAEGWLARLALAVDPKQEAAPAKAAAATPAAKTNAGESMAAAPGKPVATPAKAQTAPTPRTNAPQGEPAPPAQVSAAPVSGIAMKPAASANEPPPPVTLSLQSVASIPQTEDVPQDFKPVLQMLTQAIAALQPEAEPPETQTPPQAKAATPSPQTKTPAPAQPQRETTPATQSEVKAALALVQKAVANWPAAPSAPMARQVLPQPAAMDAMTSKIAAQTFATAEPEPLPEGALPPQIKAVLTLLAKAVEPWLAKTQLPALGTAPNTAASTPATVATASQTSVKTSTPPPLPEPKAATPSSAPVALLSVLPSQTAAAVSNPAAPNDVRALLGLLNKLVTDWREPPQPPPADSAGHPAQPIVPPPTAGAPGKAQSAATASLPDHADAATIAKALLQGSDAALARQTLLQIASLTDTPASPQANGTRTSEPRWMFDIPLMTPQGPAVAQLVIERDQHHTAGEAQKPIWRMQFAIDIEPLGPVRANLAMCGERAWVTIAADRPESLVKLQNQVSWLSDALQAQTLDADIAFQTGAGIQVASRAKSPVAKPLVDSAS